MPGKKPYTDNRVGNRHRYKSITDAMKYHETGSEMHENRSRSKEKTQEL